MLQLRTGLTIGPNSPIRINCNIGCNCPSEYNSELEKLSLLKNNGELPDTMMDLSLVHLEQPLYLSVRDELGLPFGTVLSYHDFDKANGLVWEKTKNNLLQLCRDGVSFVTIHFTADADLLDIAKKERKIPVTSRGGGIVLYDTLHNKRKQNIFREHIDEIVEMVLTYNVVVSLGTTYRPGSTLDACDTVHIEETMRQLSLINYLKKKGVKVMAENVGHISLDKLATHANLLRQFNVPIMPLGPLLTDYAENQDHVANAIGAVVAASMGVADILNCVTRYEHSQSTISSEVTLEAIRTARLAAHIINLSRGIGESVDKEKLITEKRVGSLSCFASQDSCVRCSMVCPLKLFSND